MTHFAAEEQIALCWIACAGFIGFQLIIHMRQIAVFWLFSDKRRTDGQIPRSMQREGLSWFAEMADSGDDCLESESSVPNK